MPNHHHGTGCGCHGHSHGHSHNPAPQQEQFIENNITTFVHILRTAGLTLGVSELMDALKALAVLDMTDRNQMYRGLSAVLVKNRRDAQVFDEAFQSFFVPAEVRNRQMAEFLARRMEREAVKEELIFKEKPLDLPEEDIDTYAGMSDEEKQKVKNFLKKADNGVNVTESLKPVLEQQIHSILQRQRDQNGFQSLLPVETTGVEEWDSVLYDMMRQHTEDLLLKDIADIKEDEVAEAVVLIRQLARRLATRIGRRYKKNSGRKVVDVRRSIRSGLRYGGVLMDLKYKKKRIQKPNVILLTDISGSMLKYSSFLLEMMYGLSSVLPGIRSFVFAEHLKKLDLRDFDIETFGRDNAIGDGTNLYDSLLEFLADCDKLLNRKTVLIILSDAKTLEYQKAAEKLAYIRGKVKDILWLNPMEGSEWERFFQTKAFMPYVTMMEASSIESLSKALKDI